MSNDSNPTEELAKPEPLAGQMRHCPLLKQSHHLLHCIRERCVFWVGVTVNQPSLISGMVTQTQKSSCVFIALLEISILSLNKPAVIMPGGSTRIPLGGKNG